MTTHTPDRPTHSDALDVVRKALVFADWAAGEGLHASDSAIPDPSSFMHAFYITGDETPDQMIEAVMSYLSPAPAEASEPTPASGEAEPVRHLTAEERDLLANALRSSGRTGSDGQKLQTHPSADLARLREENERLRRERDEAIRRGESQWTGWVKEGCARKEAENERDRLASAVDGLLRPKDGTRETAHKAWNNLWAVRDSITSAARTEGGE